MTLFIIVKIEDNDVVFNGFEYAGGGKVIPNWRRLSNAPLQMCVYNASDLPPIVHSIVQTGIAVMPKQLELK
jgi:hypothetical protein